MALILRALVFFIACSLSATAAITSGPGPSTPNAVTVVSQRTDTVGNVGAGTDDLHVHTLSPNTLSVDGSCLRLEAIIHTAANANTKDPADVILTEGANVTTIRDSGTGANNNASHRLICHICRTSSTAVKGVCGYEANSSDASADFLLNATPVTGTYTWANAGTLKTVAVGVADNDVVTYHSIVLKQPAPQ